MDEEKNKCINSECRKIITEKNSYICKSKYNFNQRMVICKDCVNKYYKECWHKYGNVRTALFKTCMRFDVPFIEDKFEMAVNATSEIDYGSEKVFSYYISKLYSIRYGGETCFEDGITTLSIEQGEFSDDNDFMKWGSGFSTDGYKFLNAELENWKKTHKCENKADETLLKEICIKQLELREARASKEKTKDLTTELQNLMKTAAISGDKANIASGGKSAEAFGVWIKDIEEKRPAEWIEDKNLFHDVDNIHRYFTDYVTRPTKNFITGSRDFMVDDDLVLKDGDV
jgi:hypothetical protein